MQNEKKIAVFASGSGTNFINIYNNLKNGQIVLLISNNPSSGAVKFAIQQSIDCNIINSFKYPDSDDLNKQYELVLKYHKVELILLAGFIKKIPINLIKKFQNKIINIHPSLLPKFGGKGFYGIKVHESVIKSRDKITGATIHFVNEQYDKGLIIMQKKIKVHDNDTPQSLSKRVLKIEYELYLEVVGLLCDNKIKIIDNEVKINDRN